ncbi:MAG: DoxX family membrane protein [Candidatus Nanosalina sp.]
MEFDRLRDLLEPYSGYSWTVFRTGLGGMIVLSGIHKLLNPAVWASYIAPVFAEVMGKIGMAPSLFMQFNGVFELLFGTAILFDRYTTLSSSLVTLSLAAIVVNLGVAGLGYTDIIIRDLGLLMLSLGVTLESVRRGKE